MDATTEDSRVYHQRAQSEPHIFQDLNLFQSDEEVGNFPTQTESEKRDEVSGFPTQIGSGRRDEVSGFPPQMGSGRRDARVVCETFSSGRHFSRAASPKMRQSASQKGFKANVRRRSLAYSRNPLLACFLSESVVSSRDIHLSSNCDPSGGSQRTFFSLIPVDKSRVNEKTGEPQSPQLSCIGQVKHRQVKTAKAVEVVAEDLTRMDINDGVIPHSVHVSKTDPAAKFEKRESFKLHKGEPFRLQKEESFRQQFEESFKLKNVESFKLRKEESFRVQKEESFKRQKEESLRLQKEVSLKLQKKIPLGLLINDIPHLDVGGRNTVDDDLSYFDTSCVKNSARLMRCKRVVEEEKKMEDDDKVNSPSQKHSIRYLNHFLKQKLGASMVKGGFVCGWSSGEASPRSPKSERSETESEHTDIDLSRFASGDFPPKTPSFRDTRYYQHVTGKKLPDIRVRSHYQPEGATNQRSWKEETEGKEQNDVSMNSSSLIENSVPFSNVVIKCAPSAVILQPATEAALWKRRCMPRPLDLENTNATPHLACAVGVEQVE